MANMSYLCGTNKPTTYPNFADPDYDSDEQTVAADVWCVPLLWAALFRPADIVRKTFTTDEGDVITEAPLATRPVALRQLDEAVPYLNRLFATEGPLDEYAAFLHAAVEAAGFKFLTIEMQEIACLTNPEQAFYDTFRAALAGIGTDFSPAAKARWSEIAQFRSLERFPPARMHFPEFAGRQFSDDDCWNHCRVCGAGSAQTALGRPVPWEPE